MESSGTQASGWTLTVGWPCAAFNRVSGNIPEGSIDLVTDN